MRKRFQEHFFTIRVMLKHEMIGKRIYWTLISWVIFSFYVKSKHGNCLQKSSQAFLTTIVKVILKKSEILLPILQQSWWLSKLTAFFNISYKLDDHLKVNKIKIKKRLLEILNARILPRIKKHLNEASRKVELLIIHTAISHKHASKFGKVVKRWFTGQLSALALQSQIWKRNSRGGKCDEA